MDAWLILHKAVLAALGTQNKRLVSLLEKQKEYVTKQDLKMLKDKIIEKITKALPSIAKKLVNTLKEAKAQGDESAAEVIVKDLKDLLESIE
ncbi:hypothetical protein Bca4012_081383 [Brassica carinata]